MVVAVDVQSEGFLSHAPLEDGARICPLEPEVDGETTRQENWIAGSALRCLGNDLKCHVVVHRSLVETGSDDDVVAAHVARHDVLVELYADVVAIVEDAVGRRRCSEIARTSHVLHHCHLVGIDLHGCVFAIAVERGGESTEGVGALWIAHITEQTGREVDIPFGR